MPADPSPTRHPDDIDRQLIAVLQENARLSFAELGRRIGLSPPAVAERLERLEASGVILGYGVRLDRARLGWPITAFVRLRAGTGSDSRILELARSLPGVLECHLVTGEDSFLLKLAAGSVRELDSLLSAFSGLGATTSSLVIATPVEDRPITPRPAGPDPAAPPARAARR